ncbi:hypothetical protein B0I63_003560 [Clostridium beijerinckii]|uniref:Uncharacterized protein n=1 Tax=Clostridium beijerinckii TaxID=1520 RepID=A0A9Q5CNY1_CLOBE|nr:hypothetical protein CLBIJ_33720 [Clostridium beijerinckii]MBA2887839.1 hypothetical protein [Clostridium beijerinckii]MBA2902574.1 hypothetical protein [Clostridium beijerinckii]MBA2912450.1 hypothetical protein [Clostridium beijerinckii]MBA9014468.1 hypothetical protein [Clostridium beijerinckii]
MFYKSLKKFLRDFSWEALTSEYEVEGTNLYEEEMI